MKSGDSTSTMTAIVANLRFVFFFTIMTVCSYSSMVVAVEIESSFPPNNAIDARAPFLENATELQGWQTIEIRFSDAVSSVTPGDFTLSEKGGDGIPPSIESVARLDSRTVMVVLNVPLEPGTWIELSHVGSRTSGRKTPGPAIGTRPPSTYSSIHSARAES